MAFGPNPPRIQPHLCVKGAAQAIAFYEKAFGGVCTFRHAGGDGRLLHANVEMFGSEVMLHDDHPEGGHDVRSPQGPGDASVAIHVNLPSPADVDAAVLRAAALGGIVTCAPENMFWGARYARLRDPFGHIWAFNAPLKIS